MKHCVHAFFSMIMLFATSEFSAAEADNSRGEKLFRSKGYCYLCHTTGKEGGHRVGPSLYNLFGTVAGTKPFFNFSSALAYSDALWLDHILEAYIVDPKALFPGAKMPKPPALTRQERLDLISYLKEATALEPTQAINVHTSSPYFDYPVSQVITHYCGSCHSHATTLRADRIKGTLLETYEEVIRNGSAGPIVVPGNVLKSRLMNFLDGNRHFVNVAPEEKALIKKWIEQGAKRGNPTSLNVMELPFDISSDLKYIYCYFDHDVDFASVDVIDANGQVIFSDWAKASARFEENPERKLLRDDSGSWARWSLTEIDNIKALGRVSIRLSLFSENAKTPLKLNNSSIFIVSKEIIEAEMLKSYSKLFRFESNPVDKSVPVYGTFYFNLSVDSNVEIKIYPSAANASVLTDVRERNVPAGKRSIVWKNTGATINSGDFTASLHISPVNAGKEEPYFAALIRVR